MVLIWTGLCDQYIVADDAYYYFTIARNAAAGLGPTFDTIAPTNGFHPLYVILLIPVWSVGSLISTDPWVHVHLALSLNSIIDCVTGIVLGTFLTTIVSRRATLWSVAMWSLGPWSVLLGLRGMEGSLNALFILMFVATLVQADEEEVQRPLTWGIVGLVYGLSILTRSDNAVYLGGALLALLFVRRSLRRRSRTLLQAALVFGIAMLVIAPWVLWNLISFNTVFQTSAIAKFANHRIYGTLVDPHRPPLMELFRKLGAWVWVPARYVAGGEFRESAVTLILVVAGCGVGIATLAAMLWRREAGLQQELESTVYLIGTYQVLQVIVCALVVQTYATWYASFTVLAFCMMLGIAAAAVTHGPGQLRVWGAIAVFLVVSVTTYTHFFQEMPPRARGGEHLYDDTFEALKELTPGPHVIGAFNAGAIGFFAPQHGHYKVVNLDGLVNNRILEEWKSGRFVAYLSETVDIVWLVSSSELDTWLTEPEKSELFRHYRPLPSVRQYQELLLVQR
jgi:hypothetical protein